MNVSVDDSMHAAVHGLQRSGSMSAAPSIHADAAAAIAINCIEVTDSNSTDIQLTDRASQGSTMLANLVARLAVPGRNVYANRASGTGYGYDWTSTFVAANVGAAGAGPSPAPPAVFNGRHPMGFDEDHAAGVFAARSVQTYNGPALGNYTTNSLPAGHPGHPTFAGPLVFAAPGVMDLRMAPASTAAAPIPHPANVTALQGAGADVSWAAFWAQLPNADMPAHNAVPPPALPTSAAAAAAAGVAMWRTAAGHHVHHVGPPFPRGCEVRVDTLVGHPHSIRHAPAKVAWEVDTYDAALEQSNPGEWRVHVFGSNLFDARTIPGGDAKETWRAFVAWVWAFNPMAYPLGHPFRQVRGFAVGSYTLRKKGISASRGDIQVANPATGVAQTVLAGSPAGVVSPANGHVEYIVTVAPHMGNDGSLGSQCYLSVDAIVNHLFEEFLCAWVPLGIYPRLLHLPVGKGHEYRAGSFAMPLILPPALQGQAPMGDITDYAKLVEKWAYGPARGINIRGNGQSISDSFWINMCKLAGVVPQRRLHVSQGPTFHQDRPTPIMAAVYIY